MTKGISIKKNVKPKKIVSKKPASKNKTTAKRNIVQNKPSKEGQSQEQSIIFNIGTNTPKKRSAPIRKPVKPAQSISQPIIQSYNQPIFKPPIPQQSSLASSILATQLTPKVVAEEVKEQTSLRKALQEQNTDEPTTKANDLERVRGERLKKFDKPVETVIEMKKEEPIRHALLSQLLSDQQDDTEEINFLKPVSSSSTQTDIPFVTSSSTQTPEIINSSYLSPLPAVVSRRELSLLTRPPTLSETAILNRDLSRNLLDLRRAEQRKILFGRQQAEESAQAEESVQAEELFVQPEGIQSESTPLKQPEPRGAAELVTQTETTESQPLTQATAELGFGGLTEEPIQTSVGQFLPPEPVSQNELAIKGKNIKLPSLLKPVEPPPPITEPQVTAPTLLQGVQATEVRAPDQYTTEQLVKDEPSGGAPLARAEAFEQPSKVESESKQIEAKWQELKDGGFISSKRTTGGRRKTKEELLSEINGVNGYEQWAYISKPNKPGPKLKPTVAEEIQLIDV